MTQATGEAAAPARVAMLAAVASAAAGMEPDERLRAGQVLARDAARPPVNARPKRRKR
jgi:hypothetical protein